MTKAGCGRSQNSCSREAPGGVEQQTPTLTSAARKGSWERSCFVASNEVKPALASTGISSWKPNKTPQLCPEPLACAGGSCFWSSCRKWGGSSIPTIPSPSPALSPSCLTWLGMLSMRRQPANSSEIGHGGERQGRDGRNPTASQDSKHRTCLLWSHGDV